MEVHYASDLAATVSERIVGFTAWCVIFYRRVKLRLNRTAANSSHFLLLLSSVVFDFLLNNQVLPVVCAETSRTQRADLEMLAEYARQAMQDYHGLRPYCIAIAPQGSLPRGVKNGRKCVLPVVCQRLFEQGGLPLIHVLTLVEDTISDQSLARGDDPLGGIWGTGNGSFSFDCKWSVNMALITTSWGWGGWGDLNRRCQRPRIPPTGSRTRGTVLKL